LIKEKGTLLFRSHESGRELALSVRTDALSLHGFSTAQRLKHVLKRKTNPSPVRLLPVREAYLLPQAGVRVRSGNENTGRASEEGKEKEALPRIPVPLSLSNPKLRGSFYL